MNSTTNSEETIAVPMDKYTEIGNKTSCYNIVEKGTCKTFWWLNRQYVATGATGNGTGHGWKSVTAQPVIPVATYTGILNPLPYHRHNAEVDAGLRERGYEGMLVTDGAAQLVIVGPKITFVGIVTNQQADLFTP